MAHMRILLLLGILVAASVASAAVYRDGGAIVTVTCSAGGGAAQTLPGGYYELLVSGETSSVCLAASCATGGATRAPGSHGVDLYRDGSVSCRSAAAGVVEFVRKEFVR